MLTLFTRGGLAAVAALTLIALPLTAPAQAAPPAAQSSDPSGLSQAQRQRIEARQGQFQKDITALRGDAKMTDAQKKARYGTLLQAMDRDMLAILTPTQRAEVMQQRQIGAEFQKEVAALKADPKLTSAQKQARYEALVKQANQKALATLTPAQRAQALKRSQAQRAEALKRSQAAAAAKQIGAALQKSLTPAQEKQVHAIGLATGTQVQAVIADKALSEQAKVAKITALRQQAQAKINAVLTPAQQAQYARLQQIVGTPAPQ